MTFAMVWILHEAPDLGSALYTKRSWTMIGRFQVIDCIRVITLVSTQL